MAIVGEHTIDLSRWRRGDHNYTAIPIKEVRAPPNGWLTGNPNSHDFAIFILEHPVQLSPLVRPVCLPELGADFSKEKAFAAGWGRTDTSEFSTLQSNVLMETELIVSDKSYDHCRMFGTELNFVVKNGRKIYADPCSGDSGKIF